MRGNNFGVNFKLMWHFQPSQVRGMLLNEILEYFDLKSGRGCGRT